MPGELVLFGGEGASELTRALGPLSHLALPAVMKRAGQIGALVIDARTPLDRFQAEELLRALYDDPRRPLRALLPSRVCLP